MLGAMTSEAAYPTGSSDRRHGMTEAYPHSRAMRSSMLANG